MPSIIYVSDQSLHLAFLLGVEVACFGAGQVRQTRGQRSPHKAAEQEIVSIFKAVRRCASGLKRCCHQAEGYEALPAAASLGV